MEGGRRLLSPWETQAVEGEGGAVGDRMGKEKVEERGNQDTGWGRGLLIPGALAVLSLSLPPHSSSEAPGARD